MENSTGLSVPESPLNHLDIQHDKVEPSRTGSLSRPSSESTNRADSFIETSQNNHKTAISHHRSVSMPRIQDGTRQSITSHTVRDFIRSCSSSRRVPAKESHGKSCPSVRGGWPGVGGAGQVNKGPRAPTWAPGPGCGWVASQSRGIKSCLGTCLGCKGTIEVQLASRSRMRRGQGSWVWPRDGAL